MAVTLASVFAGCPAKDSKKESRTVRGVLKHYPSDVKSVEAWSGHNFMIEETPILPSEFVSEDQLKKHVGAHVMVSGIWEPGNPQEPSAEEQNLPAPVNPGKETMIRGDGLRASSIELVKK